MTRKPLYFVLMAMFSGGAAAEIPNPLIAPATAAERVAKAMPEPARAAAQPPVPALSAPLPPPTVAPAQTQTLPPPLNMLQENWMVSAIDGNAAMLRTRSSMPAEGQKEEGAAQGALGGPGAMSGMGSATTRLPAMTLMVQDGDVVEFRGYSVNVSLRNGMVILSYLPEWAEGAAKPRVVFRGGVEASAIARVVRPAAETPSSSFASGLMPGGGANGYSSSSSSSSSTNTSSSMSEGTK